jgi:hypothetical protein
MANSSAAKVSSKALWDDSYYDICTVSGAQNRPVQGSQELGITVKLFLEMIAQLAAERHDR